MMKEWNPGDLVRHKTGGPKMCVSHPYRTKEGETMIHTRWFNQQVEPSLASGYSAKDATPNEAYFHPAALEAL